MSRKYGIFLQKLWNVQYTSFSNSVKFRSQAFSQHRPGFRTVNLQPRQRKDKNDHLQSEKNSDYFSSTFDSMVPDSDLLSSEWVDVKKNLINEIKMIDKVNVDAVILQKLSNRDNLTSAKSFANYLLNKNSEPNLACVGKVLKLYYLRSLQESLSEDEKNHILKLCRDITAKYPILEFSIAENVIYALSLTAEWKETITIMNNMKTYYLPTHSSYSIIIATAFNNNEPDIAFEILDELAMKNRIPLDMVYLSWLNFCVLHHKDKNHLLQLLQKMFDFCDNYDFTISYDVAKKVHNVFIELLHWNAEYTSISKSGRCPCCKISLNNLLIQEKDHERLKNEFYEKVVIGKNVFLKSSPEELDKFTTFLNKTAPYDMVIDGLNVSHSLHSHSSLKAKTALVVKVVRSLMHDYKKILFIGRKHMLKWPKEDMNFIMKNTSSFFLENLSHDDPFLLYAALSSPHTYFLSRDFMRGHKALLDDETQIIFKRWQQSRQHLLVFATEAGKVVIDKPMKYSPSTQRGKSWHIPYNMLNQLKCPHELRFPEKWLCLQPKKQN